MTPHTKISEIQLANLGGFVFRSGKDRNYYKARELVLTQLNSGQECDGCEIYFPVFMMN